MHKVADVVDRASRHIQTAEQVVEVCTSTLKNQVMFCEYSRIGWSCSFSVIILCD